MRHSCGGAFITPGREVGGMEQIALQLDEQTLTRARRLAEARHSSLEALLVALIERPDESATRGDPLLGMFAGEPELLDPAWNCRRSNPRRSENEPPRPDWQPSCLGKD